MKVSRKVARRSHRSRYSSVSRRRLRNKKHKKHHTQKRGKYGNRVKTRAYKHTHKRGRRFHRGGESINCDNFVTNNDNYELTIPSKSLYVKKNGVAIQGGPTQEFIITLSVKTGRKLIQDMSTSPPPSSTPRQFVVTFKRTTLGKDGNQVSFNISDLGYFTDKVKQKTTKRAHPSNETYDFSDIRNDGLFANIKSCIEKKLQIQKQELQAYCDEAKDLLTNCKIIILSSMDKLQDNMATDITSPQVLSSLMPSQTIPFFSFLLFVYYDSSTSAIDSEKTKKLLELFKSLDKYGSFSCLGGNSYVKLKRLSESIKTKLKALLGVLTKLLDTFTFTQDSLYVTSFFESIKEYNKLLSDLKPPLPDGFCSTGKITNLGIKVVGLVRVNEESIINSHFLDYDGIEQALTPYVTTLPPINFDPAEFKPKLVEPTQSDKRTDAKEKRKSEVDNVIESLGETITAHANDTNSRVRSYSLFKSEQESKATILKQQIDTLLVEPSEKEIRKANVDFYLQKILETQLDNMRRRYRAFYIHGGSSVVREHNPNDLENDSNNGLDDKDETYIHLSVSETSEMLQNNVAAFQFRMEKQAAVISPDDDVYSDLVLTPTDDSNYAKLFSKCQGSAEDNRGDAIIGNATACYKSLKYITSMASEYL